MSDETKKAERPKTIPARKPAPDVEVIDIHTDQRAAQLHALNKQDPDFVHTYGDPRATDDQLAQQGAERVRVGERVLEFAGDPVVRTPRKVVESRAKREEAYSLGLAKKTVKEGREHQLMRKASFKEPDDGAT